jgi:ABC-2 type transport system permease protein
MQGGKVLWLLEGLSASMDSLTKAPQTYGIAQSLHLDNQLFKYGVRVNNNLVMDMRSGVIPIPINNKYSLAPWPYLPLLSQRTNHPISNNINLVKGELTSSIDTIQTAGIKKTVLLASSRYAHVQNAPAPIDLRIAYQPLSERFFTQAYTTTAILLEGEFESLYKNHLLPELQSIAQIKFNEKSSATKMIVVADGDIIKNAVQYSAGKAYPLGYDVYSKQTYGNKNFILNCMNYLCDDSGLIEVRSRELKLRMLDRKKVNAEKMKWQSINTILPIGILILLGLLQAFIRKRKYSL